MLVEVTLVLAPHRRGHVEWRHRSQCGAFGAANVVVHDHFGEWGAQELKDVILNHVAHGAGLVVVTGPLANALLLGCRDLDRLDEVAVPDRFEQGVREAQSEDVLHGVLGEVVVDAVDLHLVERCGELCVELSSRVQVMAERFLENDPARGIAFGRHIRAGNRAEDRAESFRGRGEVEDDDRGAGDEGVDGRESRRVGVVERNPLGVRGQGAVATRLLDQSAELVGRLVTSPSADHAQLVTFAHDQRAERWVDLALGQVARGAKDDQVNPIGHFSES